MNKTRPAIALVALMIAAGMMALLTAASVMAQPSEAQRAEWRAQREARGDNSSGPRPPENATPEENRAFWQKRAVERNQVGAAPPTTEAADSGNHGNHSALATPAEQKPIVKTVQTDKPTVPPAPTFAAKTGEPARGGRPSGMPPGARGGGALWLSDMPPMRGDAVRPASSRGGGMPDMAMGDERGGPRIKRLWLRAGGDPQKSGFAREDAGAPPEILLVRPGGKLEGEPLAAEEGKKNLAFPMPAQGFYRVYATTRKLQGDTLHVNVAKAEVANFTHDADEEERIRALDASRVLETAPIEIVRERQPDEKFFFRLNSGDAQAFVVLREGLPAAGARVRFVSHEGWTKEETSDAQGRVSFQVVRDYFPPWQEFKKRFKATYLVIAEASAAVTGRHQDQPYESVRYQATLAGSYYPSPDDYRSYAWGLGIGLFIALFCGVTIYLYRRRRVRPFQEVRLDEAR